MSSSTQRDWGVAKASQKKGFEGLLPLADSDASDYHVVLGVTPSMHKESNAN